MCIDPAGDSDLNSGETYSNNHKIWKSLANRKGPIKWDEAMLVSAIVKLTCKWTCFGGPGNFDRKSGKIHSNAHDKLDIPTTGKRLDQMRRSDGASCETVAQVDVLLSVQ
jgi:hypothetical protein